MRFRYTINAIRCDDGGDCHEEFEGVVGQSVREVKDCAMRAGWLIGTSASQGDFCSGCSVRRRRTTGDTQ